MGKTESSPAEKAKPSPVGGSSKSPVDKNVGSKGDKNGRPERGGSVDKEKAYGDRNKADKQRAEQDRQERETQQRSRDAGVKSSGRTARSTDAQRSQSSPKSSSSKVAKESQEAARQKSSNKEVRSTPEKAVSNPGALHSRKGQEKLTKTQLDLEKLAKDPKSSTKESIAKLGGKRTDIATRTKDGKTTTVVIHESRNNEKTIVSVTTDRNGNALVHGITRREDGSGVEWAQVEKNGVPLGGREIRSHGANRDSTPGHTGLDKTRIYTAPSSDSQDSGIGASLEPSRRAEKAPRSKPDVPQRPQMRQEPQENKAPRPRQELDRAPRAEQHPAPSKNERLFGSVPNDYIERPQDYAVLADFVRDEDSDAGTLTINRGLNSMTVPTHTGRTSGMPHGSVWNAAPGGTYDIVESQGKFRLEMQDSDYGNDEADVGSAWLGAKDLSNIRLHGPGAGGQSAGCLTVGSFNGDVSPTAQEAWKGVEALIGKAPVGTRTVERYRAHTTMSGLWGKESLKFYGTITIRERRKPGKP